MLQDVQRKEIDELYKTSIVQQTAFWSIVKRKVGWQSMALNFKSYHSQLFHNVSNDRAITSDLLVIIQQINQYLLHPAFIYPNQGITILNIQANLNMLAQCQLTHKLN